MVGELSQRVLVFPGRSGDGIVTKPLQCMKKHAVHIEKLPTYFENIQSIREFREAHISPDKAYVYFRKIEYKSLGGSECKMFLRDVKSAPIPQNSGTSSLG